MKSEQTRALARETKLRSSGRIRSRTDPSTHTPCLASILIFFPSPPQLLAELCRQAFVPIIGGDHDVIFRAGDDVRNAPRRAANRLFR